MGTNELKRIDTESLNKCRQAFDNAMNNYKNHKDDIKRIVDNLLDHWEGDGRDAFEKDYRLLTLQLDDLMDVLLDLRESIVDAEVGFIEADATISKEIASA